MSTPVDFFVYNADGSGLLPGIVQSDWFSYFSQVTKDGVATPLTHPAVVDKGGGAYRFEALTELLPDGAVINYVLNFTTAASPQFEEGQLRSTAIADLVTASSGDIAGDVILRVGDQSPPILRSLTKSDGTPVDLSNGSPSVVFNQVVASTGELVVDAEPVTIVDPSTGQVLLDWPLESTQSAGDFLGEFVLTQNGSVSTYPYGQSFVIRVVAPISPTF